MTQWKMSPFWTLMFVLWKLVGVALLLVLVVGIPVAMVTTYGWVVGLAPALLIDGLAVFVMGHVIARPPYFAPPYIS